MRTVVSCLGADDGNTDLDESAVFVFKEHWSLWIFQIDRTQFTFSCRSKYSVVFGGVLST